MTEQYKIEADRVVEEKVELLFESVIGSRITKLSLLLAIDDRQNCLDKLRLLPAKWDGNLIIPITKEIQSLTQQIEYLKSKL